MVTFHRSALVVALVLALPRASALAAPPAVDAPTKPISPPLHHAPVLVGQAGHAIELNAWLEFPGKVKRAVVVYRIANDPKVREIAFERGSESWVAMIPASEVVYPTLSYAIELEGPDGTRSAVFATRTNMHDVQIADDASDRLERDLDARLGGRRSVVSASFDYVYFGKSLRPGVAGVAPQLVDDSYLRTEASYTYRPLRTVLEFTIRTGVVRGNSPVPSPNDDPKVGLNYAAPSVVFRFHDFFHFETGVLTSVTEQGFSTGLSGAMHVGDYYGTKFVLGFETVKTFGTRGYTRLDLASSRYFRISPMVEVTDMPHARAGVRLLAEVAIKVGQGWLVAVRGGYQARDFNSGGPGAGISLGYAF